MRQISIVLATAVITATVTVASMMAISSSSTRTGAVVRASTPIDVMKMMKDAKDLPEQSYPRWGPGGPWADQVPYTPRPKPSGWVDPQPSRWLWTGECDPYACPYRSQDDISPPGHDPQNISGALPAYRGSPPP